jgi:predicted amidohydrolase YtcJ
MAPADPLFSAWAAVNREGVLSGEVLGPDQRITVDQALRAITIDAARTIGADDITGSIQEGKKADFVILEEDPYLVDPLRLKDIRIRGTVFNGRYFGIDAEN